MTDLKPYVHDHRRIVYVPLGTDIDYCKPFFAGRKNYILSVGRDNGRDYKTVIEVAKLLPEKEFQIVCSKRNLEGIHEKDIPKNVKIFIDINSEQLQRKYEEASLLLLITHPEGHDDGADCSGQTVLLDAMASGIPIIATYQSYIPEYVSDKEIEIVPPKNAGAIRDKIILLKEERLAEMAITARKRVEKDFSIEKMTQNLLQVFKDVASGKVG